MLDMTDLESLRPVVERFEDVDDGVLAIDISESVNSLLILARGTEPSPLETDTLLGECLISQTGYNECKDWEAR